MESNKDTSSIIVGFIGALILLIGVPSCIGYQQYCQQNKHKWTETSTQRIDFERIFYRGGSNNYDILLPNGTIKQFCFTESNIVKDVPQGESNYAIITNYRYLAGYASIAEIHLHNFHELKGANDTTKFKNPVTPLE